MDEGPSRTFIAESGVPGQRRRKPRLACNPCRARKSGCDGKKPVCSGCQLRGWQDSCSWQDSVLNSSAVLTLADLDRRLQKLESEARTDPPVPHNVVPGSVSHAAGIEMAGNDTMRDDYRNDPNSLTSAVEECVVSPSPNFMRHGLDSVGMELQGDIGPERVVPRVTDFNSFDAFDPSFPVFEQQSIIIPPHSLTCHLLGLYWQYVHSITPVLHRPIFEQEYRIVWDPTAPKCPHGGGGNSFKEIVFHATLNMVLALACRWDEGVSLVQREYQAEEFYRRSQRLISIETLDTSTISIVQLLLLRGLYLYYSLRADRCWIMSGTAIRIAIGMGLNTTAAEGHISQLEREVRRRVWHNCVTLDQLASSTFNRPLMITKEINQVPKPQIIDDEYLSTTEEATQPPNILSRLGAIIHCGKMVTIMEEAQAVISPGTSNRTPRLKRDRTKVYSSPDPTAVLRINALIDEFVVEIPEHLRPETDYSLLGIGEEDATCFRLQGTWLHARALFAKLYILRPAVVAEVQRWTTPAVSREKTTALGRLQERLFEEISSLCLSTVHTVLRNMHGSLLTNGNMLFPAWYALHFSFAAATLLVVATLSPKLGVSMDVEPARSSWERALQIFDFHKAHVPTAVKGLEILRRFRRSVASRAAAGADAQQISEFAGLGAYPPPSQEQDQPGEQSSGPRDSDNGRYSPSPPADVEMGTQSFEEMLGSYSLDQAWLDMQDFGDYAWILNI
ncbi:fungal-specific transcription factor domain-containing protein [Cercophora scortea]|uniref:Fungal-specific transcription factor domain-containing protein n=1 Tax=Cercophora scortea TaxID=314031 RepID=A0AAE0IW78_9PEZI|nr:fungal-specific transcription factor domain-containing protein [Cercophora scortea]